MIAGKKALVEIEELTKEQYRIFPDACDYGIWELSEYRDRLRSASKRLSELYKSKTTYLGLDDCNFTWECFVPYKKEGDLFLGVKITVDRTVLRSSKSFYTITIKQASQAENPFRE
jgi:hypothetical protein